MICDHTLDLLCSIALQGSDKHIEALLESRAAAVIRNLAHNTKQHSLLQQVGAVDAMLVIMRQAQVGERRPMDLSAGVMDWQHIFIHDSHHQDPALRINAAVAVACLAGHEENHQKLLITEDLVVEMLDVLEASCQVWTLIEWYIIDLICDLGRVQVWVP